MKQNTLGTTECFQPPTWLRNGHIQTILAQLSSRGRQYHTEGLREEYTLPDGDSVELVWNSLRKPDPALKQPVTLLLHGLGGSENSHYIRRMLRAFANREQHAAVLLFRDCGPAPNKLSRSYHAGETRDLAYIVEQLARQFPHIQLHLMGYSLGANVLLKYLGSGDHSIGSYIKSAAAVSAPFQLANASAKLNRSWIGRTYQRFFLAALRKKLKRKYKEPHAHTPPTHFNINSALHVKSIWQYDELCTAPLHGFESAHDYYYRSSCRQFLAKIGVPTLILHSEDDPLLTLGAIPEVGELAQKVCLKVLPYGGHVGFITTRNKLGSGNNLLDKFRIVHWSDQRLLHWYDNHSGNCEKHSNNAADQEDRVCLQGVPVTN